jgi:hypothetical protein
MKFQRDLLKALQAATDPVALQKAAEIMINAETLTAEKKLEKDAALQIIEDSKVAVANIKKEQEKLEYLHQTKLNLEDQQKVLDAKENQLHILAEGHDKKKAELKIQSDAISKREGEITLRENTLKSAQKVNEDKTVELSAREKKIKEREDAHSAFLKTIS